MNTLLQGFNSYFNFSEMTIQLVLQMWIWMVSGFIYYGFSFSWAKLGDNIYLSYMYAALGEVIAHIFMVFPLEIFGRKLSNIAFFGIGE